MLCLFWRCAFGTPFSVESKRILKKRRTLADLFFHQENFLETRLFWHPRNVFCAHNTNITPQISLHIGVIIHVQPLERRSSKNFAAKHSYGIWKPLTICRIIFFLCFFQSNHQEIFLGQTWPKKVQKIFFELQQI